MDKMHHQSDTASKSVPLPLVGRCSGLLAKAVLVIGARPKGPAPGETLGGSRLLVTLRNDFTALVTSFPTQCRWQPSHLGREWDPG